MREPVKRVGGVQSAGELESSTNNQRPCLKCKICLISLLNTYMQAPQRRKRCRSDSNGPTRERKRRFFSMRRSCSGGDGQPAE
ncbi:hypothetical protein PoB_003812900 [Plakobranchus ocellatus]|uniref:Uncharacterized protein n=1 Tax=Plakobranchus ocellatus TaxID=259542 RepID=A0AAV4AZU9_9GAST|nr:hypothetical protein PoB_003812900 [Plakobranchus ocellatus]